MIKKLSSKIVYENKWIRLHEDTVEFPNGEEGVYAYTERVDPGSMVIPMNDDGKILVLREWRYPVQGWIYSFPFGGCETGEDELTVAKRELEEETGYTASEWALLGSFNVDPGSNSQKTPVFLAKGLTLGKARMEHSEVHEMEWINFADLDNFVLEKPMSGWFLSGIRLLEAYLHKL